MFGLGLTLPECAARRNTGAAALLLDPLATDFAARSGFARASAGNYWDSGGVLRSAAAGVPRIGHDPATLALRGLLIEAQRTNLAYRSQEFDNAAWTKELVSVSADAATAPDGTMTADAIAESASTGIHRIYQGDTYTRMAPNTAYTFSVYLKKGARRHVYLNALSLLAARAAVDLETGAISVASGTATITPVSNGWFAVTLSGTTGATVATNFVYLQVNQSFGAGDQSYAGDGVSGVHAWGAQLEAGAYATSYIATGAATATRAGDITGAVLGGAFNPAGQTAFGSVLFARSPIDGSTGKRLWQWDDGTANNRVTLQVSGAGVLQALVIAGGVTVATVNGPALAATTRCKWAMGFASGVLRLVVNGTAYTDGAPASLPALTRRRIGCDSAAASQPDAWIVPYLNGPGGTASELPRLLSVAEMQAYTA